MRSLLLALALLGPGQSLAASPGGEGGAAAHHVTYTDDDDHDGTPNWLDSDAGEAYVASRLVFHAINLAILFGIITWAARTPAADFLRGRALTVRRTLTEAADAEAQAKARYQELEARLARIEQEVANIEERARQEAAAEHAQLVARAEAEAARLAATAERTLRDEVARARTTLRKEAVEAAVQLAETSLRASVSGQDQNRLARDLLVSIRNDRRPADA